MKAKVKTKRIVVADIQKYHPKMLLCCPTDREYTQVANDLLAMIEPMEKMLPEGVDIRDMAVRLALYLEDVISEGGTWRAFTDLCRGLYGRTLPFYPEEDAPWNGLEYCEGEVNFDDVRLLMWMIVQQTSSGDSLINPHTPGLGMIASEVFAYLYDNFEKQPINPMLNSVFHGLPSDPYKRFLHHRLLMEWIFTGNYLLTSAGAGPDLDETRELMEAYYEDMGDSRIIDYAVRMESVFTRVCGPLSLYPRQWLAAMMKTQECDAEDVAEVEAIGYKKVDLYHIEGNDKEYIYLKDCYDAPYQVAKTSFSSMKGLRDCTNLITSLARFQPSCHYVNGAVVQMEQAPSMREWREGMEKERYGAVLGNKDTQLVTKEKYIQFFGGKRHKFFASQRDLVKAMTPKAQLADPGEEYRKMLERTDGRTPVFVYVCDDGHLYVSEYLAELIPARDNPFRIKSQEAKDELFCAVMSQEVEPEVIQYIIDKGWAKTLSMNSIKGKEHGKKLLQENLPFLHRFLHPSEYFAQHTRIR